MNQYNSGFNQTLKVANLGEEVKDSMSSVDRALTKAFPIRKDPKYHRLLSTLEGSLGGGIFGSSVGANVGGFLGAGASLLSKGRIDPNVAVPFSASGGVVGGAAGAGVEGVKGYQDGLRKGWEREHPFINWIAGNPIERATNSE